MENPEHGSGVLAAGTGPAAPSLLVAFELIVEYSGLPKDLGQLWSQGFEREGFSAELCPGFEPSEWKGGFLPFRVSSAPHSLIGFELTEEAISGFEVSFDDSQAFFRTAMGRDTLEFAMLCVGAGLLAELTNGLFVDPQHWGEADLDDASEHRGRSAVVAARLRAERFASSASAEEKVHHPFPGWKELGVSVG